MPVADHLVGPQPVRSIRDTSLYTASLGLFGVLAGLALFAPLDALASDVLDNPLGGNWSTRCLAVGLLALAGFSLHALTADMSVNTLATGSAERHASLPGVSWFKGYHAALTGMWSGAVLVVFLIILAAAIPRGVAVFLVAYIAFQVWNGSYLVLYLGRNGKWARLTWRGAINPIGLVRQLASERFVPASPEDVQTITRGEDKGVELMIARVLWFGIWETSFLILWSTVLWMVVSTSPGLASSVSFAWLVTVVADFVLWYRLNPQFFTI